jgi:Tfp pilus assembly protein PilF
MATAAMAQSSGQLGKARLSLEQASKADQWSADAMLWLADYYCWRLILEGDSRQVRQQWESCLADVKRRAGDDPAVYRMIGAQQLHAYQRHGEQRDLGAAAETFEQAVQWSPANQWMMAQMAVVAEARGQRDQAQKLGKRAAELAELGGNIERALSRQQVYEARPLGRLADQGPIRQPANQLLSGLITPD